MKLSASDLWMRWQDRDVRLVAEPMPSDLRPITDVLVMAVRESRFLLADIVERGWCVPSGRVEQGEKPEDAARRETLEETGATLGECVNYAYYEVVRAGTTSYAALFVAPVLTLGTVPPGESQRVRLVSLEELPRIYHFWNATLVAAFQLALEALSRCCDTGRSREPDR